MEQLENSLVPLRRIEQAILQIRGQRVMLVAARAALESRSEIDLAHVMQAMLAVPAQHTAEDIERYRQMAEE